MPPKNLTVVTRWFGARSQIWSWRQLRRFARLKPSVISWTHENAGDFPLDGIPIHVFDTEQEPNDGTRRWSWRLRNLPSRNFYGTQGSERARMESILRENRTSVILCHFGHAALRILPAASALGIPVVPHFHGLDISSGLNNRWYRWSITRMLPRFPAIVCVGSHQRRKLIELGGPENRIHVISCGVPTAEFPPAAETTTKPDVTFITVSRLVEWKGVHHSLAAFARVFSELPQARLVIVGDGPEDSRLRAQAAQLELPAGVVQFTGSQPQTRVRELLQKSDVFLQHSLNHPSGWFEGFGVSIAEASATSLPVVVSECGGITDQVLDGKTGLVVPQRDEAAMAAGMLMLARDPDLRRRLGQAGRQRMVSEFDTDLQVKRLESVLLAVAR